MDVPGILWVLSMDLLFLSSKTFLCRPGVFLNRHFVSMRENCPSKHVYLRGTNEHQAFVLGDRPAQTLPNISDSGVSSCKGPRDRGPFCAFQSVQHNNPRPPSSTICSWTVAYLQSPWLAARRKTNNQRETGGRIPPTSVLFDGSSVQMLQTATSLRPCTQRKR